MTVTYNKLVQKEVSKICDYYDECANQLGDRYFLELTHTIDALKKHPLRWSFIQEGSDKRKARMKNFPYVIVYKVISHSSLRILVVKHQKRRFSLGMRRK